MFKEVFEIFRKDKNIKKNNGIVIGKLGIGKYSDYDIVGHGRNGIIKFNNEAIDKLVELYRDNKEDEIIKYCNSLYEEIGINSKYENFIRELCNEIILSVLQEGIIQKNNYSTPKKIFLELEKFREFVDEEIKKRNIMNKCKSVLDKVFFEFY